MLDVYNIYTSQSVNSRHYGLSLSKLRAWNSNNSHCRVAFNEVRVQSKHERVEKSASYRQTHTPKNKTADEDSRREQLLFFCRHTIIYNYTQARCGGTNG